MFDPPEITARCRICGDDCVRANVTREWVHVDDEVRLRAGVGIVSMGDYDHRPDPDIIDVTGRCYE